ncbi:transposase, MuDR, plant [Tanacetum coccineum]|uniref:Transposase, MuDR, plant n=1 Tax=Tanacetum coccineum TaxID=301880 RepID=A0ABQ4YRD6_9ASTR
MLTSKRNTLGYNTGICFGQLHLETWSIAFFTTDKACYVVENRISKCFSTLIVDAKRKPIINMLEDIKVDEILSICSCRGWQLSSIPYEHGIAALYFLHQDLEQYVSGWYKKDMFMSAYNHYIKRINGMDQWPSSEYQKPLPPIKRRMLGRPPHKGKRDATEDVDNRTMISRKGNIDHCKLCIKSDTIKGVVQVSMKGMQVLGKGFLEVGKGMLEAGKELSIPPLGFEMYAPESSRKGGVKLKDGMGGESLGKERSTNKDSESRSSNMKKLRTINGKEDQEQVQEDQEQVLEPMFRKRVSERIKQLMFNMPPSPGPGLSLNDAISVE